eukprot:m.49460 g.49460  ORF g.49460 m.49460 type:complete len:1662 (+) comp33992_c0_seq1:255-5240(+)
MSDAGMPSPSRAQPAGNPPPPPPPQRDDVSLDEMLSLACRQGKQEIAELLLDSGAQVNHRNKNGNTPLLEACSQDHVLLAGVLLDRGADIDAATDTTNDSALTWACTLGNDRIVRLLLHRRAGVEHRTKDGCTALMFAALAGHVDVAELLLDYSALINVHSDSNMDSPLTFACWKGHVNVVDLLLEKGADLEHRTKEGFTPLMFAALGGHTVVAERLLKRRAKVNVPSGSNNDIPLTSACWKGHRNVVELLLTYESNLEHRTKDGCTPLMLAAREGHYDVAELILRHGGKVNTPSGSESNIPLTLACWKGHVEVVRLLLDQNSAIEHQNKAGCTPLMLAAREGHFETTKLLLSKGTKLDVPSGSNDDTPLTLACWKGHADVVELLLLSKSNIDHQTKTGCTPLMEATREGHSKVVGILLRHGADVETPDNYGQTPLFMACWKGHTEVAALLLRHGANKDCRTKTGITPLFQACREDHVGIVRLLLDHGCSVNATFPSTRLNPGCAETPLTLAAEKGFLNLVSLLLNRGAMVDSRSRKGCSPLLLCCREGHKEIATLLAERGADMEVVGMSPDERRTTPLLAAFRNGHVHIVEWLLNHINHCPSMEECQKTLQAAHPPDRDANELQTKRMQCMELISQARDLRKEAAERTAQELVEEIDAEKEKEKNKRRAAQRRKEKKREKKQEKKQRKRNAKEEKKADDETEKKDNENEARHGSVEAGPDEDAHEEDEEELDEEEENVVLVEVTRKGKAAKQNLRAPKSSSKSSSPSQQQLPPSPTSTSAQVNNNDEKTRSLSPPSLASNSPPSSPSNNAPSQTFRRLSSEEELPLPSSARGGVQARQQREHKTLSRIYRHASESAETTARSTPPRLVQPSEETRGRRGQEFEFYLSGEKESGLPPLHDDSEHPAKPSLISSLSAPPLMNTKPAMHSVLSVTQSVGGAGEAAADWQQVVRGTKCIQMSVSNVMVGRIFGRGGTRINRICDISGAQINIPRRPSCKGEERIVTIKGTSKAVTKAQQMIEQALNTPDALKNITSVPEEPLPLEAVPKSQPPPPPLTRSASYAPPSIQTTEPAHHVENPIVRRSLAAIHRTTSEPRFAEGGFAHGSLVSTTSAPPGPSTPALPSNVGGGAVTECHRPSVRTISAPARPFVPENSQLQLPVTSYGGLTSHPGVLRQSSSSVSSATAESSDSLGEGSVYAPEPPPGGYGAIGTKTGLSQSLSTTSTASTDTEEMIRGGQAPLEVPTSQKYFPSIGALSVYSTDVWTSAPRSDHYASANQETADLPVEDSYSASDGKRDFDNQYQHTKESLMRSWSAASERPPPTWSEQTDAYARDAASLNRTMSDTNTRRDPEMRHPLSYQYAANRVAHLPVTQADSWPLCPPGPPKPHPMPPESMSSPYDRDVDIPSYGPPPPNHRAWQNGDFRQPAVLQVPNRGLQQVPVNWRPYPPRPEPVEDVGPYRYPMAVHRSLPKVISQHYQWAQQVMDSVPLDSPEDLAHMLHSWGLNEKYIQLFREKELTLSVLMRMSDAEINSLGLPMGPRKKLECGLESLRDPSCPPVGMRSYMPLHAEPPPLSEPAPPPAPAPSQVSHKVAPVTRSRLEFLGGGMIPSERPYPGSRYSMPAPNVVPAQLPLQLHGRSLYQVTCRGSTVYCETPSYYQTAGKRN